MSKELFVTSTPHETKLAVVEDDQLVEVFFERENEYTLAGSVYKGRVTRVLPGMQSAFVDIGLERDAFLYVTDFMELEELEDDDLDLTETKPHSAVNSEGTQLAQLAEGTVEIEGGVGDAEGGAATQSQSPEGGGFRRSRRRRRGRKDRFGAPGSQSPATDVPLGEASAVPLLDDEEGDENGFTSDIEGSSIEIHENGPKSSDSLAEHAPVAEEPPVERPSMFRRIINRIILPGESLAKFKPKPEVLAEVTAAPIASKATSEIAVPSEIKPIVESSAPVVIEPPAVVAPVEPPVAIEEPIVVHVPVITQVPAPPTTSTPAHLVNTRTPSTLYTGPIAITSEGLLAGETRRKRVVQEQPAPASHEPKREQVKETSQERMIAHTDHATEAVTQAHVEEAPSFARVSSPPPRMSYIAPVLEKKEREEASEVANVSSHGVEEIEEEQIAGVGKVPSAVVAQESVSHSSQKQKNEVPREQDKYNFRPGAGQIEEEEILEEEHDHEALASEHLDEMEEELEEETLEMSEHAEDSVLAAGDRLAAAMAQSRAEAGEMTIGTSEFTELASTIEEEDAPSAEDSQDEGDYEAGPSAELSEEELGEETLSEEDQAHHEAESGIAAAPETSEAVRGENRNRARFQRPRRGGRFRRGGPRREGNDNRSGEQNQRGQFTQGAPSFRDGAPSRHQGDSSRREGRPERSGQFNREGRGGGGERHGGGGRPPMRGRRPMHRAPLPLISDLLKEGQEILVQIAKEPMAKKGARITSHIALPGRFLVFMPTVNHTGVSRKIASIEERQRLKRILLSEKGDQHGGFIVRTAASGANEEELRADIRFLLNLWSEIRQRAEASKPPALIYHDLNLVERILRDQVTGNFSHIWVDTDSEYERILRFATRFQPSLIKRVKMWTKSEPLFESFGIAEEINKALKSKVWLKSGGYIVINQTEALVAIDINTGKFVGKTARLEDTITKTNIDAIKEIVRQIRLRDLGGIIIIDFIDMDERKNRQRVLMELENELRNDRSPSKVLQFNDFGLVAITRKRVKQSLERTLGSQCSYCTGTGFIKSVPTICNEIYVEMRKMASTFEGGDVMLRVHPEVAKHLKADGAKWLMEMEEVITRTIIVKSDPALHQEQFDMH